MENYENQDGEYFTLTWSDVTDHLLGTDLSSALCKMKKFDKMPGKRQNIRYDQAKYLSTSKQQLTLDVSLTF